MWICRSPGGTPFQIVTKKMKGRNATWELYFIKIYVNKEPLINKYDLKTELLLLLLRISILSVLDILSIIQLEDHKEKTWLGHHNQFLSLRVDICFTFISAFNLVDLGMISNFPILSMCQNVDMSYSQVMDIATDLSGLHLQVKSRGEPYTYSVWLSSFHSLWEVGWAIGSIGKT